MKYSAIILAAGKGLRTGLSYNKILQKIHGKYLIDYSIDFFLNDEDCAQIILVVSKENQRQFLLSKKSKISHVILGGNLRQESVFSSLSFIQEKYVFIHDGARPFIPKKSVAEMKRNIVDYASITLGVFVTDTIQRVKQGFVEETLNREQLIFTQTPQAFHKDQLVRAHHLAREQKYIGTDDASLLLKFLDTKALVVKGDKRNLKFTSIDDLPYLEVILK
jgi:2-C-methyl-D-erythritol 4-phosphate cytidylyltransferase